MAPSIDSGAGPIGRALGTTEENWVRATASGTGMQVIGVALKKYVEVRVISLAAREVLGQYALLRTQIVETSKGKLAYQVPNPAAVPAIESFPWPSATQETAKGSTAATLLFPGDDSAGHTLGTALQSVVKQELNAPFRNATQKVTGPVDVFRIHVYTESSLPKTLIILKFNSGAIDRPSAVIVAQCFLTALNAVVDGKSPQLPEAPGKADFLPTIEELIPKGKASKSLIQKGFDTINYAMSANKFSLFPFSSGYVESKHPSFRTDILSFTLGKEGTSALLARSKKEETTYGAALSAAFLKGVASVKELKDKKLDKFSFTSLLDCRPYLEPAVSQQGLGNFTAGISQDEQVKTGADFWQLARSISASYEKEKGKLRHFSELPVLNLLFSQVLKRPSLTQKTSLRTALFSLFVDGPVNAQWKNVEKLEMAGTFGPFASMHGIGPCFCLAEALVDGPDGPELNLSVVFPTPVYSRDQMGSLAKTSLEELNAALQ